MRHGRSEALLRSSAGVESVSYFETTGWRGVMERATDSALPDKFPSRPGAVFPTYHLLADLAGFDEGAITFATPTCPLLSVALFQHGKLRRILVANLTDDPQQARLASAMKKRFRASPILNSKETSAQEKCRSIIDFKPYEILRLESSE